MTDKATLNALADRAHHFVDATDRVYAPEINIGQLVSASSDESGAPDVGMLLRLSERQFLWCGEITKVEAEAAGVSDLGWHIVLHDGPDRRAIAQVNDSYDGIELMDAIAASLRAHAVGEGE